MKRRLWLHLTSFLYALVLASTARPAATPEPVAVASGSARSTAMVPILHPNGRIYVSGHLTEALLQAMDGAGVRHVVSVSALSETAHFDEAQAIQRWGLQHHQIPVTGPGDLTPATVAALDRILRETGTDRILLHCGSGNRVGALMALRAGWLQGLDVEAALQTGRAHGLTRLEAEVRQRLLDAAAAAQAIESAGSRTDS